MMGDKAMYRHKTIKSSTLGMSLLTCSLGPIFRPGLWCSFWVLWLCLSSVECMAEVRYRIVQLVTNEAIGAFDSSTWAGGINRHGDVAGRSRGAVREIELPPVAAPDDRNLPRTR